MKAVSPRVARRQAATRARILNVAARCFATSGFERVRLDEIADAADVARGTLYNYFPSKESLVSAILHPLLEKAARRSRSLARRGPRRGVEALLALYLDLWHEHPDALRLADQVRYGPLGDLATLHQAFLKEVWRVFARAAEARLLRSGSGELAARLVARLAVPLLEICAGQDQGDALFLESLEGLLLRPGAARRHGQGRRGTGL